MRLTIIAILSIILLGSCASTKRLDTVIYEDLYSIEPEFEQEAYFRQSTSESGFVYFTLRTEDLLHRRPYETDSFVVEVLFNVEAIPQNNLMEVQNFSYRLSKKYLDISKEEILGRFPVNLKDTVSYIVRLGIQDVNNERQKWHSLFLSTDSGSDRYVTVSRSGIPKQYATCEGGGELEVEIFGFKSDSIVIEHYDLNVNLPPPPFSINSTPIPDYKLFESRTIADNGSLTLNCLDAGAIRLVDLETDRISWISLFDNGFPKVNTPESMLSGLRYITTSEEFNELQFAEEKRKAIEEFWISCAGSRERAKGIMASFYDRVEEANIYFTDRVAGWKTDRGLIHIVYGRPTRIMRYSDREIWYYGSDNSANVLQMTFYRTQARYSLDRSLEYRPSWYLTVDSWRNGRAINP